MAFRESPRFPEELMLGSHGGPLFRTHVVVPKGGNEQRNHCWSKPLAVYEIGVVNRETTATNLLRRFFRAIAMGRLHGFRFPDPLPGEQTGTNELLGVGDGVTTAFQLVKHYTLGPYDSVSTITKPVIGSTTVTLNDTPTTAFTVNTTTGVVTMTVAPSALVLVRASCVFDIPVRFDTDHLDIQMVEPGIYSWPSIRLLETRTLA